MKTSHVVFIPLILFFAFVGCSEINVYHKVLVGNNAFKKGFYQEASYNYFLIKEGGKYQDIINYNLGNVYYALGFDQETFSLWNLVENSEDQDLRFRAAYNLGVKNYEDGNYQKAFDYFRRAIIIGPTRFKKQNLRSAKLNLQLCLDKIQISEKFSTTTESAPAMRSQKEDSKQYSMLMQFIEKKESIEWSNKQHYIPENVEDY